MKDMRSAEAKADSNARYDKWSSEIREKSDRREAARDGIWGKLPWQLIDTCKFEDWEHEEIYVTDGKNTKRAKLTKRFGRPRLWHGGPIEYVLTDQGMQLQGDGEWKEPDWPDWMFEWEFADCDGVMTHAGGHETGREEIGFVPTHWLPSLI